MKKALMFAVASLLAACGSDPLAGTWTVSGASVENGFASLDASLTYSAGAVSGTMTTKTGGSTFFGMTFKGTYTTSSSGNTNTVTETLTSISPTDASGTALTATSAMCVQDPLNAAGVMCDGFQFALNATTNVCVCKSQSSAFTISGTSLNITVAGNALTLAKK